MFETSNERPTVEESYQVAGNTSNLTVEADVRGAGDVLIAAGWSESRVGMALLRLHSEWDGASKSRREPGKPASAMSGSDLRLLATSLKSRPAVWAQLAPWLALKGIASEVGAAALLHWLHPSCPHCDGHGLKRAKDAPALTARQCSKCHGTGHRPHPQGSAKVLVFLDDCVSRARQSLKNRLRNG